MRRAWLNVAGCLILLSGLTGSPALAEDSWVGSWTRVAQDQFSSATLEISQATDSSFDFSMNAMNGGNMGEMAGTAKIADKQAVFEDAENSCSVTFVLGANELEVSTTEGCSYYAGNGVFFDGAFRKGKIEAPKMSLFGQGVLQNQEQEALFAKLLGKDYEAFVSCFQITFEDEDLEHTGAWVRSGGVRGLFSIMEATLMIATDGRIWAAYLDEDNVKYFTNDAASAKKLPLTLEAWRNKFPDKKLVFMD